MDMGVISVRYARALLKCAGQEKAEDGVYRDMQCVARSYAEVPQLAPAIDNPMLGADKKEALLTTACGPEATPLTRRFVALVMREGRESIIRLMAASYISLYRKQKNITRGRLITATAVSADVEGRMRDMVERKTRGAVEFQTEVDADLIGGFVLEYDTYRMDASVKTQLRRILTGLKS